MTFTKMARVGLLLLGARGWAHDVDGDVVPTLETIVRENGEEQAASQKNVSEDEWKPYSLSTPGQMLEVAPGLVSIQHAGGGKANQYYLRGFDADHGTDLLLTVDGVPANMVSHGHGQGYADLNFVIPETVKTLEVTKGPYFSAQGDFATAGAVNFALKDSFENSMASVQAGSFNTLRGLLVAALPEEEHVNGYLAAEVRAADGPFVNPERLRRFNLLGSISVQATPRTQVSLRVQSSAAGWYASGQIPESLVNEGQLGFFGTLNPFDGGASFRHLAQVSVKHRDNRDGRFFLSVYGMRTGLNLFSDFTFFAQNPLLGDQIEQEDVRWVTGLQGTFRRQVESGKIRFRTEAGLQVRFDDISNGLYRTFRRERIGSTAEASVSQTNSGIFVEEDIVWSDSLRTVVGARGDFFAFRVTDRLEDVQSIETRSSGTREALQWSPKFSLRWTPWPMTVFFLNVGRGFHSNDARGVVLSENPASPLSPATGYELGVRNRFWNKRVDWSLSAFGLELDSELVWVGDEGTTEARGATRRRGVEFESRTALNSWLTLNADFTWVHARFQNGDFVPLAPPWTANVALQVRWRNSFDGALRLIAIGQRPANEDGSLEAEGFAFVDAVVGYTWKSLRLELAVRNLTDARFRQAQFATASRPFPQGAVVEQIHFTPGVPRMVLAGVGVEW